MHTVILAGGIPQPNDPLFHECMGMPKALIDINGKPMLQWVVDAVNQSKTIEKIYIVGLTDISKIHSEKSIIGIPDQGGIIENLAIAAEYVLLDTPKNEYFLSISADIPLINATIIDHVTMNFIADGTEIFYNVVEESVMSETFSNAKRTYIKLKDGKFCGGDMHIINAKTMARDAYRKFVYYRKSPLKLILVIGVGSLLKMFFNPPTLNDAMLIINKRTKINAKALNSIHPELAMDIDKPEHLTLVRKILE